jgi:hypothetical protein
MPAQLIHPPFTFFNQTASTPTLPKHSGAQVRRLINIQAGLAELMLLNRLRARTRRDLAGDTLERAAHIIEVTSRHWFGEPGSATQAPPAPD